MANSIILKKNPKIEFQLHDNGFNIIDEQTERNNGFYDYSDLQSIDLNSLWFPRVAHWLRGITWVLNAVPFFPHPEDIKKANIIIRLKKQHLGIWLTDASMAQNAEKIKNLIYRKNNGSE